MFGGPCFCDETRPKEAPVSLDVYERSEAFSKLEIPQIKAMMECKDKRFIANHIILTKEIQQNDLKFVLSGGFSHIFLASVEYYPISSHKQNEKHIPIEPYEIKKSQFILKREIAGLKTCSHNRQLHER